MRSRGTGRRKYFYGFAVAAFLAVAALAALSFISMADLNRLALEAAENDLLSEAMLIAQSVDGTLRLSEAVLEEAALRVRSGRSLDETLTYAALALPEADNVYFADRNFRVLASASARNDPKLLMPKAQAERMRSNAAGSVLLAEAPAEGGLVLAFPRPAGAGAFVVAVFRSSLLESRLALLLEPSIRELAIVDEKGQALDLLSSGERKEAAEGGALEASYAFANYPLKVHILADRQAILAAPERRVRVFMPLAFSCAAAALALFGFGIFLERRAAAADRLSQELEAKELLFREVNHRVKNNLAVAGSIISLGESAVLDASEEERAETAIEVLRDTRDRIISMAMLHEQLYKHSSDMTVDLGAYLADLSRLLAESYASPSVRIDCEASEGLALSINRAVPMALIVTELVTNANKHAFPEGKGAILIRAKASASGGFDIEVRDDGIGLRGKPGEGFGSLLVEHLSAQLGGSLRSLGNGGRGTAWLLSIPPEEAQAPPFEGSARPTEAL